MGINSRESDYHEIFIDALRAYFTEHEISRSVSLSSSFSICLALACRFDRSFIHTHHGAFLNHS